MQMCLFVSDILVDLVNLVSKLIILVLVRLSLCLSVCLSLSLSLLIYTINSSSSSLSVVVELASFQQVPTTVTWIETTLKEMFPRHLHVHMKICVNQRKQGHPSKG